MEQGRNLMRQLDPAGVGARDLRECLIWQIEAQRREAELLAQRSANGHGLNGNGEVLKVLDVAAIIVEDTAVAAAKGHAGAYAGDPPRGGAGAGSSGIHPDARSAPRPAI